MSIHGSVEDQRYAMHVNIFVCISINAPHLYLYTFGVGACIDVVYEHVTDHYDVVVVLVVVVILLPCRAFYLFIVFSTLPFSPVLQLV